MRKLMLFGLLILGTSILKADTTSISDQFLLSLVQHVVAVNEFTTHGQSKTEFLDGIVQVGHYKGNYILAFDGGFSNSLAPNKEGKLATTFGAHLHLVSFIRNYVTVNTDFSALDWVDCTPRWSYDADVHKGVLGITVGARIPFGGN